MFGHTADAQFSAGADLRGGVPTPRYRHGCIGGVSDSSALAEARRDRPHAADQGPPPRRTAFISSF